MEKQRWEESERRSQEVRRAENRKTEKKEDAGVRKGRKVAIHCVFPMICGSGWSKSRLAKAAGEEPAGQKCTPLWREAHFQVKMYKAPQIRSTFRSWAVEKVHAVVARSTFVSKKGKNTARSDRFWKLRCRKSARRCGAQRVWKSKVSKTAGIEPFLTFRCRKSAHWLT